MQSTIKSTSEWIPKNQPPVRQKLSKSINKTTKKQIFAKKKASYTNGTSAFLDISLPITPSGQQIKEKKGINPPKKTLTTQYPFDPRSISDFSI